MSIINSDDKPAKPLRTKITQRNNKLETNLTVQEPYHNHPHHHQQSSHSISPIKITNTSNDIYSNADSLTANSTGYRVQQYQQYNKNIGNSKHLNMHQHQDSDRMSLGSINMPLEDIPHKQANSGKRSVEPSHNTQRRTSFLRKHWQQHSDVPFVIGADVGAPNEGMCERILLGFSWFLLVSFFPFSLFFCMKVVQEYERAVIFRLGRLVPGGAKGPGMFLVLPCIETYTKVDMRTVSFDVPPQEVLTKDSVTVAVDAVVYYRVFNPVISIANVENAQESTRLLAQTSLRNVLGTNSLAEILSNREAVSLCMREILDEATDHWGIKVERVEIKDVRLPIQLQRAMAAEAEATREARAKVIAAEGEHKASRALKDAADILSESSSAIQLRYLQTLNNIAGEKNSTIIFPLPIEIFSGFLNNIKKPKEQHHHQVIDSFPTVGKIQHSYKFNNNDATDL